MYTFYQHPTKHFKIVLNLQLIVKLQYTYKIKVCESTKSGWHKNIKIGDYIPYKKQNIEKMYV